jgi:ribose 5-phosphate isomerase A
VWRAPTTFDTARSLGLDARPFAGIDRLDLAIDGVDQVDPAGWLVKGDDGAHTGEKIVAAAAAR